MRRVLPLVPAFSMRVVVASVAIVAGTSVFPAQGQGVYVPPSTPHVSDDHTISLGAPLSAVQQEAAFPHPLSGRTVEQYRLVFRWIREGRLADADRVMASITDRSLIADVQAERFMRRSVHVSVSELKAWLKAHPKSPDVPAVSAMLHRVTPNASSSDTPHAVPLNEMSVMLDGDDSSLSDGGVARNALLDRTVQERASHGASGAESALKLINATPGMSAVYAGKLYGDVALDLLSQGDIEDALRIGANGFDRGSHKVGFPAFVGGLAAWHNGQLDRAYSLFEAAANAPLTEEDHQAAAAFWAARVEQQRHETQHYETWLRRAAVHAESFYGFLAARLLGESKPLSSHPILRDWPFVRKDAHTTLTSVDLSAVISLDEGRHFFSLLQLGEQGRAEMLARRLWAETLSNPVRARSLQMVVYKAGMVALSDEMGRALQQTGHQDLKETLTPLPTLHPHHGFRLNPALVYAVARMESNFDPHAASAAGAYGMMQIMPRTASFVTAHHIDLDSHGVAMISVPPDMTDRLKEAGYNLDVGQLYMKYLAEAVAKADGKEETEKADLVRVLASYNAGPQAITHWEGLQKERPRDPLYYIESLPNTETRQYVHHVLLTAWLYGQRMAIDSPSLVALSEGRWPSFQEEEMVRDSPS